MVQKTRPQAESLYGTPQPIFNAFQAASIIAKRAPTTLDTGYQLGTIWVNKLTGTFYGLSAVGGGVATWVALGATAGGVLTLTGNTGGALSPTAGNLNVLGTANQVTFTGAASTLTASLPATLIAPGSIAAASGNITATSGNFVSSAAGNGLLFNANTATGAAPGPVVLNSRAGQVIFSGVSIAAAADLTLTITNSAITGATTQVIYAMYGATTGSALSIKSVTNSAGSSAIVVTNGTGATTTVSNITFNFIVVN